MRFQNIVNREYDFLKPEINLNIASEAIPPMCVQNALSEYCRLSFCGEKKGASVLYSEEAKVKTKFATLIGATESEIAMVSSTAVGIGIFASGYPFENGDNVIVYEGDHPSCLFPFIELSVQKGVQLKVIPKTQIEIGTEQIEGLIDNRTKAVVISAVQYSTGFFADLKSIGLLCKQKNILLVVDGIQAVGRMQINVKDMGIDYMSCGSKKGLLSVSGNAFVYCSSALISQIRPVSPSLHSTPDRGNPGAVKSIDAVRLSMDASRLEVGTPNHPGLYCLAHSLDFILELGIENISVHIANLEKHFRDSCKTLDYKVITFSSAERCSGIVAIEIPDNIRQKVVEQLSKYKIVTTLRDGYLRISFGVHNKLSDVQACVECLSLKG